MAHPNKAEAEAWPALCLVNQLDNNDQLVESLPDNEQTAKRCKFGNCGLQAFYASDEEYTVIYDCEYERSLKELMVE